MDKQATMNQTQIDQNQPPKLPKRKMVDLLPEHKDCFVEIREHCRRMNKPVPSMPLLARICIERSIPGLRVQYGLPPKK